LFDIFVADFHDNSEEGEQGVRPNRIPPDCLGVKRSPERLYPACLHLIVPCVHFGRFLVGRHTTEPSAMA
jgi:hypothetical protein